MRTRLRWGLPLPRFMPMLWRMNPSLVGQAPVRSWSILPSGARHSMRAWAAWAAGAPRLLVAFLALGLLLVSGVAQAGTLQVRDTAGMLSSGDRNQIESVVSRYPFDVRLLTSSAYADQGAFSRYVGSQVNEANEVVIGLDPVHHHTQVHFGTGSHIASSSWPAIERAGNSSFHDGRWGAGVIAILDQAAGSVGTGGATSASPVSSKSSSGMGGILLVLFVIAIPVIGIMVVVAVIRRFTRGPGYGSPGYGGPGYGGPGYGGGGKAGLPGP